MTIFLVSHTNRHGFTVWLRFWSELPATAELDRLRASGFEAAMREVVA
jgi:hypothetical protein